MTSVDTEQSDAQWTKLTVLQLKGALVRRGLNNEGTKPELIARLSEYEQLNKSTKDESMEEDQEVKGEVKATYLDKRKMRDVYEACRSLRTVYINPFKADVFEHESARACLMECSSFIVKNMPNGNKVAEMWFDTVQKGQECCNELSSALTDCEVAHPKLKCTVDCDTVERYMNLTGKTNFIKETEHVGFPEFMIPSLTHDLWGKCVILEGMSQEMNTEAILRDFFPEAEVHLPFDFDQAYSRFAVLVFGTIQAAKQYLELVGSEPVPLQEGVDVKVTLQPNYWKDTAHSIYTAELKEKLKKEGENVKEEILTDEERLTLVQEVADIVEFIESHQEIRVDSMANVQENIKAFQEMLHELKEKKNQLSKDAEKRVARGDTEMPEPLKEKQKAEVNVEELTKELTELRILREKAHHEHHRLDMLVAQNMKKLNKDNKKNVNEPSGENNAATKGKDSFNKKKKLQQLEKKKRKISLNEPVRGSQGHYRVFIYGLPTDVEEPVVISKLMKVFKKSGGFVYIKLQHNKGKAYLTVKSKKDWANAIALQGFAEISGTKIQVGDGSDQDENKWLKEDRQIVKKTTGKNDQKRKANGGVTCHKCGGAGHMQRECRATGIAFGQPASKKGRMDRGMNKGAYNMMDNFSSTLNRMEQIGQMLGQSPYGNMGSGMSNSFGSSSATGNAFGSNSYGSGGYGASANNGYGNNSYGSYSNYANKSNSYSNKAYGYNN